MTNVSVDDIPHEQQYPDDQKPFDISRKNNESYSFKSVWTEASVLKVQKDVRIEPVPRSLGQSMHSPRG